MEGYVQGAVRKELLIVRFLEKQLLWESLIDKTSQYFEQKLSTMCFMKGAIHYSFCTAL